MILLLIFALGLPPLAGAVDYTRDIPMSEIIDYARQVGVRGTLRSDSQVYLSLFIPAAACGLIAFCVVRRKRARRVVLAVNLVLPMLWVLVFWPVLIFIGPPVVISALLGRCGGEVWSESFVSYSALGTWSVLWLAVIVVLGWSHLTRSLRRPQTDA